MKKTLLLLFFLNLLTATVWAGIVTEEQALNRALQFLQTKRPQVAGERLQLAAQPRQLSVARQRAAQQPFYVFNVGQDKGFVMVSGDDRTPAILGYGEEGSMDLNQLPDNLRYWLEEYERQIAQLDHIEAARVSGVKRASIAPMITTYWGQDAPYNNLCPIDTETQKRSVTGCLATAMAQVMYYHKYPAATTVTIPAYRTYTLRMLVPAIEPTTIDWDNMLPRYTATSTELQQTAVAKLMQLCGSASRMDYSSEGSGASTSDLVKALYQYFGYDEYLRPVNRYEYTIDEWNDLIYAELAARRPVLYAGYSMGGGHQFVIDGYSDNDLFHVNWGWDGRFQNTYFLLSILNPGSNTGTGASTTTDGYSIWQEAMLGVQPPTGQRVVTEMLQTYRVYVNGNSNGGDKLVQRQADGTFTATLNSIQASNHVTALTMELAYGLFDAANQLVGIHSFGQKSIGVSSYFNLNANIQMGKNIPDGRYTIKAMHRVAGDTEWQVNTNSYTQHIGVVLAGNNATLTSPYSDFAISFDVLTERPAVGSEYRVRVNIANHGTPTHKMAYFGVNGTPIGGQHFEAEPGKDAHMEFAFTLKAYGSYTLSVMDTNSESFYSLADTTVVVEDQSLFSENGIYYRVTSEDKLQVEVTSKNAPADAYQGSVTIPATVTHRGATYTVTAVAASAFQQRTSLTEINIGDNVTTVGQKAFYGCTALTTVGIGSQVSSIAANAFQNCSAITTVKVNDVATWCRINFNNQFSNPLYSTNRYSRHLYVGDQEVSGRVVYPEGVTATGFLAFYDCAGITEVVLPQSLTLIDRHTFSGCKNLSAVNVPNGVTELGHSAFINCESLPYIELPAAMKTINKLAFSGCKALEGIRVRSVLPPTCKADDVFDAATYEQTVLYVPLNAKGMYEAATTWKKFAKIQELGDDEQPAAIHELPAAAAEEGTVTYYDLNGRRLDKPAKGVSLKRQQKADGTVVVKKIVEL